MCRAKCLADWMSAWIWSRSLSQHQCTLWSLCSQVSNRLRRFSFSFDLRIEPIVEMATWVKWMFVGERGSDLGRFLELCHAHIGLPACTSYGCQPLHVPSYQLEICWFYFSVSRSAPKMSSRFAFESVLPSYSQVWSIGECLNYVFWCWWPDMRSSTSSQHSVSKDAASKSAPRLYHKKPPTACQRCKARRVKV